MRLDRGRCGGSSSGGHVLLASRCPWLLVGVVVVLVCALFGSVEGRLHERVSTTGLNETESFVGERWRFPLHQVAGTQHVNVYVGQPAVRQTWIVDTGSHFTATVCGGPYCPECGNGNHNDDYLLWKSFTHRLVVCGQCQMTSECQPFINQETTEQQYIADQGSACKVRQQYTEGSKWTAWEVSDIVAIAGAERVDESGARISEKFNDKKAEDGSENEIESQSLVWDWAVPLSFGCQTELHGLFRKQYANGILGLEYSEYSWISVLHKQGLIPEHSFGLCLHPKGGWLTLGARHSKLSYTLSPPEDLLSKKKWFSVNVQAVWLGQELLASPNHNSHVISAFRHGKATILDSGTTDTFFPVALAPIFEEAWKSLTGRSFGDNRAYSYTFSEFQSLPELHLLLAQNVTWTIFPKFYMELLPLDDDDIVQPWSGRLRLIHRLYLDERIGAVLGLNAMMGYHVEYHKDRIGIAPANCHD